MINDADLEARRGKEGLMPPPEDELGELEPDGGPDYLSDEAAARALAGRIEAYWHARGHPDVTCWVELAGGAWVQRSSLDGSGSPPPAAAETTTEERPVDGTFRTPGTSSDPPDGETDGDEEELTAAIAAVAAPLPGRNRCLWPIDDAEGPIRWCGARVAGLGKPYCKAHQAAAQLRPAQRRSGRPPSV
jgi:hypothetical protein